MNAIIRDRGFGLLADAGDIGGRHNSSFGIDEPSTVASILAWIDAGSASQPFFVSYLPIAGHHPYEAPEGGPFSDGDEFGRYRNALHYGDAALGALRRGLEARGLDRRTLWIVFGDHGEAFGQHEGNYGHTFQLYDENVRVPFLVAAPGLLSESRRIGRVVSLLDTAPTALDLLGVTPPDAYQGTSMLDGRPRMALFFTDYSLALAGLRDGPRKFIHDLRSGRSRSFDLDRDPDETVDLSARYADESRRYAATLEAWTASRQQALARPLRVADRRPADLAHPR
jgi:arylsulfatase A-like enzyme